MAVWIAGWFLIFVAVTIAAVVTIQNLRGARGLQERRFVFWSCLAMWGTSLGILALAAYLQAPWRYVVVVVYAAAILPGIYWAAMRRQLIRQAEQLKKARDFAQT